MRKSASGRKVPRPVATACDALLLAVAAARGPAEQPIRAPVKEEASKTADTSSAEEWRNNCALHRRYHNERIFSAVETAAPDGQRTVASSTRDRRAYLDTIRALKLDSVPEWMRQRGLILEEAASAPGGRGIAILPRLNGMVRLLWHEVEAAARKHGISCREPNG